ncbi:MAG: hypothetical protein RL518_2065, partial [Pseudomonadota bacterium]
ASQEKDRFTQYELLLRKKLEFSDERHLALAAALHECQPHGGENILGNYRVRCSTPGIGLGHLLHVGISVYACYSDSRDPLIVASGAPLPRLNWSLP